MLFVTLIVVYCLLVGGLLRVWGSLVVLFVASLLVSLCLLSVCLLHVCCLLFASFFTVLWLVYVCCLKAFNVRLTCFVVKSGFAGAQFINE